MKKLLILAALLPLSAFAGTFYNRDGKKIEYRLTPYPEQTIPGVAAYLCIITADGATLSTLVFMQNAQAECAKAAARYQNTI